MGALDAVKAAMEARKLQSQFSKIRAAGEHGIMKVLVQAPDAKVVEKKTDIDKLSEAFPDIPRNSLEKIVNRVLGDYTSAIEAASKEMQKTLASSSDLMDSMKSILGQ